MKIDAYSATGTLVHTITKSSTPDPPPYAIGVYATRIATGGTNRVVVAGGFVSQPWIQVLDLP